MPAVKGEAGSKGYASMQDMGLNFMPTVSGEAFGAGSDINAFSLEVALTSADSVIYRWDLISGEFSFSDNITSVFPFNDIPPRKEANWLEIIAPEDQVQWLDQKIDWQKNEL